MEKLVKQILNLPFKTRKSSWSENLLIKLFSLVFAVFLWYFVTGEDKVDMTVLIPVEIVNLPRDLVISSQVKRELEVTVSGARGLIRGISDQKISRTVDLSDAKPGPRVIRNDPDSIKLPRGIQVLRIQPTHMNLMLDRLAQKEVPIRPTITGTPAEGYELTNLSVEPPRITLSGPQTLLDNMDHLSTFPFDISNATESVNRQVTLDLSPEIADLMGESVVTTRVIITEKMVEKRLTVPIEVVNLAEDSSYALQPAEVELKVQASFLAAKNLKELAAHFHPQVDLAGLMAGKHERPVTVAKDIKAEILNISPENILADIKVVKSPEKVKKKVEGNNQNHQ